MAEAPTHTPHRNAATHRRRKTRSGVSCEEVFRVCTDWYTPLRMTNVLELNLLQWLERQKPHRCETRLPFAAVLSSPHIGTLGPKPPHAHGATLLHAYA